MWERKRTKEVKTMGPQLEGEGLTNRLDVECPVGRILNPPSPGKK